MTLLLASPAHADEKTQQARTLVQVARQRFDQGEFVKAAELLETAFELAPQPEILFNLARARERGGQLDAAVTSLRRYLELSPTAKDRKAVEATIADLDRRLEERRQLEELKKQAAEPRVIEPAPPVVADAPRVEQPPPVEPAPQPAVVAPVSLTPSLRPASRGPWVVMGVGALGVGAGGVLGAFAQAAATNALVGLADVGLVEHQRAKDLALAANFAFGISAALITGGLVWLLVDLLSR